MTVGGETGLAAGYVFDNAWLEARRRLQLLEGIYDPGTTRRLADLGVGPGWSCLEVAGGAGSITKALCQRVGPTGRVVAVDLDTRFLEEIRSPQLEVVCRDVLADGLPEGEFDLVHVRALLMHLHERHELLDAVAAAVRPGGLLLVEEAEIGAIESRGTGAFAAVWDIVVPVVARAGLDPYFARRLPELLCGHGFSEVGCQIDDWLYRGGTPAAEFIQVTLRQLVEKVPFAPEDRAVIEAAITELDDTERWFPPFVMLAAWGRRPDQG